MKNNNNTAMVVTKLGETYTLEDTIGNIEVKGQILDYEVGFPAVVLSIENEDGVLVHSHYSKDLSSNEYVFNIAGNSTDDILEYASQMFEISVDAVSEILNENEE